MKTANNDPLGSERTGLLSRIKRRLSWYVKRFKMDNEAIGAWIQLTGNQVTIDGIKVSVDNPLIRKAHKSTVFFGIYEEPERRLVKKHVRADDSIVELGGSIGVVACIANKLLNHPTQHVVVEANPTLLPTLHVNRDQNECRFRIVNAAVAYGTTQVTFSSEGHFLMGHIGTAAGHEGLAVSTCALSSLLSDIDRKDLVLLCDIEGAEIEMVRHEADVLARHFRLIIMETHPNMVSHKVNDDMLLTLKSVGFRPIEQDADVIVMSREVA